MSSSLDEQFDAGVRLLQSGQFTQAEQHFAQLLAAHPSSAQATHLLGLSRYHARKDPSALALIQRSIELAPDNADFHMNLGNIHRDAGRITEAIASMQRAIAIRPDHAMALSNLANIYRHTGRLAEAIVLYQRAIQAAPEMSETYTFLGNALKESGDLQGALAAHQEAVKRDPKLIGAYINLGGTLHDLGRLEEAIATYQLGLTVDPNSADLLINLIGVQREAGQLDAAAHSAARAVALAPQSPLAHSNRGITLLNQGQIEQAVASFREALRLAPRFVSAWDNLLFAMHYRSTFSPGEIFKAHQEYARALAPPPLPATTDHNPNRKLRIGYVSADLRGHPVGRFLHPILKHRDRSRFEVHLYATGPARDSFSLELKNQADAWHDAFHLTDPQLDALIRQHRIDILIDLAGHTAGNRLIVFGRKPAPVQVTYLGYPDTTGVATVDFRITDTLADPPGAEQFHTEKLLRIPQCFLCFQPPPQAPPVSDAARNQKRITFGSFNNFAKVSPEVATLWAQILHALPTATLLIKSRGLADPGTQQLVRDLFHRAGADVSRLDIRSHAPRYIDHLAAYDEVDIALDTFPYHGTTTTCEALWMGVPVITLTGPTHASRVGQSLLTAAGLPDFIAHSPADYVNLAIRLARDNPRRHHLRQTLRSQLQASPLCDAITFTKGFESALLTAWGDAPRTAWA